VTTISLTLMPRAKFSTLSLYEKNAYLQALAADFCAQTGRPYRELDKDVLARLRRYYSRRVWADLKLTDAPDTDINRALRSLGEAIQAARVRDDVTGALTAALPGDATLRPLPPDDAQLSFFMPAIYDAPIKDDVNLMDVAPFAISKSSRPGVIQYELKDCIIKVEGGAEAGIATVFDYDIFLNMVSYLAEEVRRYRAEEAKGLRPSLPPRFYQPGVAHILKFCRRSDGGRAYTDLEGALNRLSLTRISIINLAGGKRRHVDSRPLIGRFTAVSRIETGRPEAVRIEIPEWIYQSIVRPDKTLSILTIHPDYFLIQSALGRVIYRLARKAANKAEWTFSVREVHRRSGSTQELRFFARDLRRFVATTKLFPLPEYDLDLIAGRDGPNLRMRYRAKGSKLGGAESKQSSLSFLEG
jgi:plasmid replication initiation protein